MSNISTFTIEGVKICWTINPFYTALREFSMIESPLFLLRNEQWNLRYWWDPTYKEDLPCYHFGIHSADETKEIYKFVIKIERTDGFLLFEGEADYVHSQLYQCDMQSEEYDLLINYLYENREDCVIFICKAYDLLKPSKYSASRGILREDQQDVFTQTLSLEAVQTLSDNLKELFKSGNHADIKIKVGSKEFNAHKLLLAARSSVLNSMFSSDMLENKSGVLNITDCDEDAFEGFLMFLYSGKLEDVRSDKIAGLYEIADKYDLPELRKECIKRMTIDMSIESICDVLRVATLFEEKGLLERATNFFISNADKILDTSEWEIFLDDHPKTGNELFKKILKCKK